MICFSYPPGYFVQKYTFDFFNYAGIHRPVKLYTSSIAYLADITINTTYNPSTQVAQVSLDCKVGAQDSISAENIFMNYRLLDNDGYVLSNISGLSMFKGVIDVKNPNLWWPIGMSNKTAYLYTLQVGGLYVF